MKPVTVTLSPTASGPPLANTGNTPEVIFTESLAGAISSIATIPGSTTESKQDPN